VLVAWWCRYIYFNTFPSQGNCLDTDPNLKSQKLLADGTSSLPQKTSDSRRNILGYLAMGGSNLIRNGPERPGNLANFWLKILSRSRAVATVVSPLFSLRWMRQHAVSECSRRTRRPLLTQYVLLMSFAGALVMGGPN
jgi:hypothetical protein